MNLRRFFYFLMLFLIVKQACAIGISPGNVVIDFVPNFSTTIEYSIVNTMPFDVGAEINFGGPLSRYMNISQTSIKNLKPNEVKRVTITINLPENIDEPGLQRHTLTVTEQRKSEASSGIIARGGVIDYLDIWVLYPEKYPKEEFTASDASVNDTAGMNVKLWNYGKPAINKATGYVEIMDLNGTPVGRVGLSQVYNIKSFEFKDMQGFWNTKDIRPSVYKARAFLDADGQNIVSEERNFKIGELTLKILGYTQSVNADQINEFEIVVENIWNHDINNVFAEVYVTKEGNATLDFKTLNYNFIAWEKKSMKGFFNTAGLEPGTYDTEIVLKYADKITSGKGTVVILKRPLPSKLIMIVSANVLIVLIIIIFVIFALNRKSRTKEKKI